MRKDPLSEFLKQHADSYKVTPSSSSFEGLMERRAAGLRRRRQAVWACLSIVLLGAFSFLVGKEYGQSGKENSTTPVSQMDSPNAQEIRKTESIGGKPASPTVVAEAGTPKNSIQVLPKENASVKRLPGRIRKKEPKFTLVPGILSPEKELKKQEKTGVGKNPEAKPPIEERKVQEETPLALLPQQEAEVKKEEALPAESADSSLALEGDTVKKNLPLLPLLPARTYKWSISAIYSRQLLSELYSMNSEADLLWLNTQFKESDRKGKSRKAFTAGLKLERNFGKHFGLSAGATYSKIYFQKMPFYVTAKKMPSTVYTVVPNVKSFALSSGGKVSYSYDESLSYLDVPLMLYYRQHHKKMIWYGGAGVSGSYLLSTQTIIFDSSTAIRMDDAKGERLSRLVLAANFSAGVGYQILPRWGLYAGPVARFGLNGIYDKTYCNRKSNFIMGLEGGLKFLF